jgi:adenylate cyclase class IV
MNDALLEIYETDADLSQEPENIRFQSYHRDMIETKAMLLFRASGYNKDFMVYNRKTMQIEMLLLTNSTKAKRGECQQ